MYQSDNKVAFLLLCIEFGTRLLLRYVLILDSSIFRETKLKRFCVKIGQNSTLIRLGT